MNKTKSLHAITKFHTAAFRYMILSIVFLACIYAFAGCRSAAKRDRMLRFFHKGNEELQKKEYQQALRYYSAGIKLDSSVSDIFNNRGVAYFELGEYKAAIQDYDSAIRLKADYWDAYLNRAHAFYSTKKYQDGLQDLKRLIKIRPDSLNIRFFLARVQLKLKDYASGIENLNIILQKKTDNTDALDSRGFLYLKMKAYKKAEADLQKAIQLNPQQDLAWANLGLLFTAQGDWLQALTHLDKAVMLNPNEVYSLNSRAWARLQQNQLEKAEADILASLRLNEEDNAAAYRNKGILEYKRKNNPEAVKYLREALTQDSTDELTLQYLKELQKH